MEGGLILYINENVPCKLLTDYAISITTEIIILEFDQSRGK